jgi:hypothetical protein
MGMAVARHCVVAVHYMSYSTERERSSAYTVPEMDGLMNGSSMMLLLAWAVTD